MYLYMPMLWSVVQHVFFGREARDLNYAQVGDVGGKKKHFKFTVRGYKFP
jgi:hypothetical protein